MGYRTVVILQNDLANEWRDDPNLGRLIAEHAHYPADERHFKYGNVAECVHNDVRTLMDIDAGRADTVAHVNWYAGCADEDQRLRLLKQFADSMGYTIRRKPK